MPTSPLKPFMINGTDIDFLRAQVSFRPLFDVNHNAIINWDGTTAIYDSLGHLLYTPPLNEVAGSVSALAAIDAWGTSYQTYTDLSGLRDPSGSNNNLAYVHSQWGAVDQIFPRMVDANYTGYASSATSSSRVFDSTDPFHVVSSVVTGPTGTSAYAITAGTIAAHTGSASDGTLINENNVVDGSPRTISLLTTTGDVTFETWGDPAHVATLHDTFTDSNGVLFGYDANNVLHSANEIYYDASGVAVVSNWGQLETVANGGQGQVDTQARLAGSAGQNDHFIGGLNPGVSPSNGFFVLFGQFFDHGLDFIGKGEQGKTITITLDPTDPLYGMLGPDGQPTHSITIARANVQTFDANGQPQYVDHTSPYIDQSQTYGSHQQLTNLLREWVIDPASPDQFNEHPGMRMFDGTTLATAWTKPDGTLSHDTLPTLNELRWSMMDSQRTALSWEDISNLRNRDANGIVDGSGNSGSALLLDSNPRFDVAHLHMDATTLHLDGPNAAADAIFEADFMNAIVDSSIAALNASLDGHATLTIGTNPGDKLTLTVIDGTFGPHLPAGTVLTGASALAPWVNFTDFSINSSMAPPNGSIIAGFDVNIHDAVGNILMASVGDHYIAGDGRTNENIGLTSVHHVFHEEHNFQVQNLMDAMHRDAIVTHSLDNLHSFQIDTGHGTNAAGDYVTASGEIAWDMDKMFSATKLIVEMEYQHAAVDQYARNVTPNIQEFVGYSPDKDPSVSLEYSQVAFRFGHSTLRETIDTIDPTHGLTGKIMGYALRSAFLNPELYSETGPASILMGMTHQQMNEVDEFVTPALNQGLLGQPLDLAAINIARGRDIGIPTLNDFRVALGMTAYTSWTDFGNNMQHPSSLGNFIAAYSFTDDPQAAAKGAAIISLAEGTFADAAAGASLAALVGLTQIEGESDADFALRGSQYSIDFLDTDQGFQHIDTWLGGLAEIHQPGGILGETFDRVFVTQIESLMDGDRFYYLFRLAGQQFASEIGGGQLKDIVERNTGLVHLNGNIFGYADQYVDLGAHRDTTALQANGGDATTLFGTGWNRTLDSTGTMLAINSGDTVGNEHKYGDNALVDAGTMGVYTNGGRSNVLDGTTITIGGTTYIRDTRLADSNPNSAYAANGGTNLDGTPNSGAESSEIIVGTRGADLIYAQGGDDTVYGEDGNDIIYGGYGIDRLYGGAGSDRIYGGDNPDLIDGGAGDDFLYGESSGSDINGNDQLEGGSGNDLVDGGIGIDKLNGGSGDDHIVGGQDTDPFTHGGDGNDLVEGNSGGDILYGDNGDDIVVGGADQDQMFGGNGDDIIRPGDPTGALTIGTDEVLGGDGVTDVNPDGTTGFDIIDFSDNTARPNGVTFDLSAQQNPAVTVNGTPSQVQSFQMEGVVGSVSGDTLTAGSTDGNDVVQNDWLIGGSGSDTLITGDGNDLIIGGSIKLTDLVGKYNSTYDHNNNNDGSEAVGLPGVTTTQEAIDLQDALYQGASHRAAYDAVIDNTGLIDAANAAFGDANEKHFTELLRSDQFRNTVLGDGGADVGSTDTVVFNHNRADYTVQAMLFVLPSTGQTVTVYRVHDNGGIDPATGLPRTTDGTDIVVGVETFKFADGPLSAAQVINVAPAITSNGGGDTGATSVAENTTFVTTVQATDANNVVGNPLNPQALTYSISAATPVDGSNADRALFSINAATGALSFIAAPNFEVPADAGANNVYNVIVQVSDGLATDSQALAVTVTNVNEPTTGSLNITGATATNTAVTLTATNTLADGDALAAIGQTWSGGATPAALSDTITANLAVQTITLSSTFNQSGALGPVTVNAPETAFVGSTGADAAIAGTTGRDFIFGMAGGDTINGGGGNDVIDGGAGNDIITGGAGNDTIDGGAGNGDRVDYAGGLANFVFDVSGSTITVTDTTSAEGTDTVINAETIRFGANNYAVIAPSTAYAGANGSQFVLGTGGNDALNGGAGNDVIVAGSGVDSINGGVGNDSIFGGAGNDTITYEVNNAGGTNNGGRDYIDGGAGTDTFVLIANNQAENFVIYTRAEAITAGIAVQNAGTEIVITRQQGANPAAVVAELKDIQEITIQTNHLLNATSLPGSGSNNPGPAGTTTSIPLSGGNPADNIKVVGDFTQTTLAYNTITVNGAGNTVDITQLTSDHRVVLDGAGSSIVGAARPQDVINGVHSAAQDLALSLGGNAGQATPMDPVGDGDVFTPSGMWSTATYLKGFAGANLGDHFTGSWHNVRHAMDFDATENYVGDHLFHL